MSPNKAPLGDLLAPAGQHRAGTNDYPVLSITMKQGLVDQADKFKKRVASQDTSNYRVVYRNELVVGFPIDEGVLGFQTRYPAAIVSPAYDIWRLKNETDCHIPYLERYLRSIQARRLYASRMQGAVARRRSLTKGDFLKLEIPFPPIHDQMRIAHLLQKVEGLIAQRKQQLQHLDELLGSVFLAIFGDPIRNEKGWDKPSLRAFGRISTGNTPPRNDASNYEGQHIEWIKSDNISADSVFVTKAVEYLSETGVTRARTVSKGALLVACIAGSMESIGRAALTDRDVAFNQQINAIQPANDVSPFFLYGMFKLSRFYIQSHASEGMKKILTKGDFEQITMIKPPFELQQQFTEVAERIEFVKANYQQSFRDLEVLYGALSQQAFKGELDLSRVPLADVDVEALQTVMPGLHPSPADLPNAIDLPDTKLLQAALGDRTRLKEFLSFWLETYRAQMNGSAFSAQAFLAAAQTRIAELHPDSDFEFEADAYDQIKTWVFEALASDRLTQGYADADNRVTLAATAVQSSRG